MKNLNILNLIGNTPLIKIQTLSEITGCEIFGKAEFLNPCGSVKDRAAKAIILDAEKNKKIEKGGTIVEGTAGNTGISLTMISNVREYSTVIVMPETQSNEKKELLKTLGAELKLVPAVPYKDDNNYIPMSKNFDKSIAFKASVYLVLEGDISPSGYTEPILHKSRLQLKSMPD